jgi:hypothetical protein
VNPKRTRPWTREDDIQLLDLRNRHVRFAEIEQVTGRTLASLQSRERLLRKLGVEAEDDPLAPFLIRVPNDDPLLARLKRFHGDDNIERDVFKLMEASLG